MRLPVSHSLPSAPDPEERNRAVELVLSRSLPRLKEQFLRSGDQESDFSSFEKRLHEHLPRLLSLLLQVYGSRWDFLHHLEELLALAAQSWLERPPDLRRLDSQREKSPHWFISEKQLGGVLYVDLYTGNLRSLRERLPEFRELGLTYLHLMPLFDVPPGNSDGGYAVSSYRRVRPDLGTMSDLAALASDLREQGISLVVDFVFNHTADDHDWARAARAGDPEKLGFYHTFPDRTLPDLYEQTVREIFPTIRRGSFTFDPALGRWVWTTFHSFQWDLNYANPAVFNAMAGEMLFLANQGVEVLRLDAVAFIWKRLGTDCENQPEAHLLVQAFNAVARIAAPALHFKSEAIVHPDEVQRYIAPDECQLSYNPLLMALCWEALATREVRLLDRALRTRHALPPGTAWVNYLRSHDDIGWTFDDQDARAVGIDPHGHRRFLNDFYTGRFPGSFARGLPFQENPVTGDARVSGTLASLAGLEAALHPSSDPQAVDLALRRILLLYSVILTAGGIPLLYLGDEVGQLNDYSFARDPEKAEDSRWVHRLPYSRALAGQRHDPATPAGQLYTGLKRLLALRASIPALAGNMLEPVNTDNPHVIGYIRSAPGSPGDMAFSGSEGGARPDRLLVLANFSEHEQPLAPDLLRRSGPGYDFLDLLTDTSLSATEPLLLLPCQSMWLRIASAVTHQ